MTDILSPYYLWIQSLHIISVVAWMAALFYLPRLFVYHAMNTDKPDVVATLKIMQGKLLKVIMTPAMIATWVFGVLLVVAQPDWMKDGWMHTKLLLVVLLSGYHGWCVKTHKTFLKDANTHSHVFYRYMNEVPTLLMITIVVLVVVKPF